MECNLKSIKGMYLVIKKTLTLLLITTGVLTALFFIFCLAHALFTYYINQKYDFNTINSIGTILTSIATASIFIYTVKSVNSIKDANKQNEEFNRHSIELNEKKNKHDIFEKKFSLLLQEHNQYLNKLISIDSILYKPDVILSLNGFKALSIIRGESIIAYYKYMILLLINDDVFISI